MENIISTIIPIFNSSDYLERCINSLLAAQIDNVDNEILLINDGSTDTSGEICNSYASKNNQIKVFHVKNAGVSAARNLGLLHAKGEWVSFVDSDDFVEDDYFKVLDQSIKEYNDQDILVFNYYRTTDKNKTLHIPCENIKGVLNHDATLKLFENTHENWFLPFPVNKLYRRELIVQHEISFDEGMRIGEDTVFNMNLFFKAESIAFIDEAIYNYFSNPKSVTNQTYKSDYLKAKELRFLKALEFYESESELNKKIYFKDLGRANIERMYFDLLGNIFANKNLNFIQEIKILRNSELMKFGFKYYPIRNVEGLKRKTSTFLLKHRFYSLLKIAYKK